MPRKRQRHYYPAATFTVVVVALLGAVSAGLRRYVPPPPLNSLSEASDPFLVAGSRQKIRWRKLNRFSLAEARREGRPILLLIGDTGSKVGRLLDRFGFTESETADFIERHFVPIRVDSTAQPYMASAYDPVFRSRDAWDPAVQIWFLDPEGKPIGGALQSQPNDQALVSRLSDVVTYFQGLLERTDRLPPNVLPPGVNQQGQVDVLLQPRVLERADVAGHEAWLRANVDSGTGAWTTNGLTRLNPMAYRFLVSHGDSAFARANLDKVVTSGVVDWVNGGFFTLSRSARWGEVDFSKYLNVNADMAFVCAAEAARSGSALYRQVALDTFDVLTEKFADKGLLRAYRLGDERGPNRSQRSSFPLRLLLTAFDGPTRDRLRQFWDLDVARNPQMLPQPASVESFDQNREASLQLLEDLRAAAKGDEQYVEVATADTSFNAIARLIETARLLNDPDRLAVALNLFNEARVFRTGANDVLRRPTGMDVEPAYLGDYLAYADAALQASKSTGALEVGKDGLAVLSRALEFFSTSTPGVLINASPEVWGDLPPLTRVPEVVDRATTSSTAQAIRLAWSYAAWIRETSEEPDEAQVETLRAFADRSVSNFAEVANLYQRRFSSYFDAAGMVYRDQYAVVSGPSAIGLANELSRSAPGRLVLARITTGPARYEIVTMGNRSVMDRDAAIAALQGPLPTAP